MHEGITLPSRRGFLRGLSVILAAPAIVTASNLMPVRALKKDIIAVSRFGADGVFTFNNGDRWSLQGGLLWEPLAARMQADIYKEVPMSQTLMEKFGRPTF